MKNKMNTQKGITLVALVITIIVLLILVVVAIGAIRENGIINYAKNSTEKYAQAKENEISLLQGYVNKINITILGEQILPEEYQQIEYIESSGAQYIDTGIRPVKGFGIWMDFEALTDISTSATSAKLFGSSLLNEGLWGGIAIATYPSKANGYLTWFREGPNSMHIYDPGLLGKTRMWVQNINNVYSTSTGYSVATPFSTANSVIGNLFLFAINAGDSVYTGAGIKLYGCKLYNGEDVVKDFIPCYRKSDNEVGLYDIVEEKFYENQGTGEFIAGPKV